MEPNRNVADSSSDKWIWPFELIEQIGEGGMGIVYRARYVVNNREVALKMLPKDVTDATTLARFERELDVLKKIKHPNIVRCFGGSCENNRRFYAMELVEGGTLDDKLEERQRLPWEQVIFYGLQMCDALDCSHGMGVIHRDVKPSNFLLTPSGMLKLSDFGLASVAASRRITAAGKTAGTFLYMAPEQIHGHEVSPRTDLYALGCVLYELITGEPPFIGATPAATLHMHCRETPERPTVKALDCPVELEKIILALLEKKEEDRPQTAKEVSQRLKGVKQTVTVLTPEAGSHLNPQIAEAAAAVSRKRTPPDIKLPSIKLPAMSYWLMLGMAFLLCIAVGININNSWQLKRMRVSEKLWVQALGKSELPIKLEAYRSLGEIAKVSGHHLETLKAGLNDTNPEIREVSAQAIGVAGGRAKTLLPSLFNVLKNDPDNRVREAASVAAAKLESAKIERSFPWGAVFIACILVATGGTLYIQWRRLVR